ncbi:MAG TPA: polyprenyl synthetase family protein [Fimbriimonadales bacterium]|nr:polyprenyl synthetase family protein [Fimbriimonadales bacterium]
MNLVYLENARESISQELMNALSEDIRACEEEMQNRLRSPIETVEKVGLHISAAGGKRLRPALVSLSARGVGKPFDRRRVHRLGACMEMIHMATLIHDDVVDEATLRRGKPTPSALWGNTASVLSGDVLLAKAMEILAEDGDLEIIRTVSRTVVEMAEGEVAEIEARGDFDLSKETHYSILKQKTASFMGCCCLLGGLVASAEKRAIDSLSEYGENLGMAFQIMDDLLDYLGDDSRTGKPRATDFREGCATLPLIFLRKQLDANESNKLRAFFGNGISENTIHEITTIMKENGVFSECYEEAKSFTEKALSAIQDLPKSDAKDALETLAQFVIAREV